MPHQYVHTPRATEVERKLEELRNSTDSNYIAAQINSLTPKVKETLNQNIKPNENFIKSFKERQAKESQEKKNLEFLNTIDEQGHRVEKVYQQQGYLKVHDPISIYKSQDPVKLAWKVYTDVEQSQIFLKTLYYPELRSEDYSKLVHLFSEEHKYVPARQKFGVLLSLAAAGLGYSLSTRFSFKVKTSLFTSLLLFSGVYWFYGVFSERTINQRLNKKAVDIAKNYPEIQIENIQYTKINH
jgi:hypothetical protein